MAPGIGGKDHYAILEISVTADDATVAASYRRLARLKHPDKNRTNPNATAEFQALQEAYTVLKDSQSRAEYDRRRLHVPRKAAAASSAPRARATATRAAAAPAGAAATMAATAAAVEMLRQKRKQARHDQSAAAVAGIFAFHVHSGGNNNTNTAPTHAEIRRKRSRESMQNTASTAQQPTPAPAAVEPLIDYSEHGAGTMYPPPPADPPRWPDGPPRKDDVLEDQIRRVRREIRAQERTIRRLNHEVDRLGAENAALWDQERTLDDQLAKAAAVLAKAKEKIVEREWHDALFSDQTDTAADPLPLPRPMSPQMTGRMQQAERAYEGLQKKLAETHEAIETTTAASRLLVDQIEDACEHKSSKEAMLHELGRQWRVHEFGLDSVDGENSGHAGAWDGWCGWDEGEGGFGMHNKSDDTDSGSARCSETDNNINCALGQEQGESASWWNSSSEAKTMGQGVDGWGAGDKKSASRATRDPVGRLSDGLGNLLIDTRAEGTDLAQSLEERFEYQDSTDNALHEPSDGEDSTGGGVALGSGSFGEGNQRQRDWQRQEDAELIASEPNKTESLGLEEKRAATRTSVPTDLIADLLQTATATSTRSPMHAVQGNDAGETVEREEQPHGWLNESAADMLGQVSWAPAESPNVWNYCAVTGTNVGAVADANYGMPSSTMSLPLPVPTPHRHGIDSHISTLAGPVTATQAWWPGEEYVAEQGDGDAREMAWRHAQWHEW
ncbi:hypothetical protein SEPCBS119000_003907 [Sporothrix epigloea]|uniref:J domain-containing protein n=1 Tax=Sporothrix epigloea TaxID=1892477 RepID=A0ABP0DP71_9PEZI